MKQRIRVVGLLNTGDGALIFKRNRGRSESPALWELPTGKIKFGEQPEEAVTRVLSDYAGLSVSSIELRDVITFLAPEGSSQVSNLYIVYNLGVTEKIKPDPRDRYTAYKFIKDFANSGVKLTEASLAVLEIEEGRVTADHAISRDTANSVMIYVDGASRGNPGPAGIGYCIYDSTGQIVEQSGEFIGFATSRVAEYYAMRKGVKRAVELSYKTVRFYSDSLMVVNQLSGIFHIKNRDVIPIYEDIQQLLKQFEATSFIHIPRSENTIADHEANIAIDNIMLKH